MIRLLVRIGLVLLVLNQLLTPVSALGGYGSQGNGGRNERGGSYKDPYKSNTFAGTSSGIPSQNDTRRGLGISAWGIVIVILSIILAGMGFYYFSICYPILCKKKNKYDMMALPAMA